MPNISTELKNRQRQRSKDFRKTQALDGRKPVIVFLTETTRAKLKTLATAYKVSPQLPLIAARIIEEHADTIPIPSAELGPAPKASSSEGNVPEKVSSRGVKKSRSVRKAEGPSTVTLAVESVSDLIVRVRRLARACDLESKRLRKRKVNAAEEGNPPPVKERRKPTRPEYYKGVMEKIEFRTQRGESAEEAAGIYKRVLEEYANVLEIDLNETQAQLKGLGAGVQSISDSWPLAPVARG